jgi:alpha-amylase/alpha-mannosidase (GH57 family)
MRYICIHSHCYQPPRENPWLETIELQESAYPYHDWNERITAECYAPNTSSRILDSQHRIVHIVNNYASTSYNFGPTLLSWMQTDAREAYRAVIDADRESQLRFSGHGSAMAQAYNHMILPLANRRDKYTQILWGIQDFRRRFSRLPEGMWLPETAVDLETLDIMAELGIKFTILSPYQAHNVRDAGATEWRDVTGGAIDPTRAYYQRLPSRRTMNLFFYDGPVSQAVAFERLLDSGERFANRLVSAFSDGRDWDQMVHIATDGETYGHHHRYGEMALAYALHHIESNKLAEITNYGEYLWKHPPDHEVEIYENTAWSCVHGVGRWSWNCGCNSGGRPGWNQEWRQPLRNALDWLRDRVALLFERVAETLVRDPWEARNDYIQVILDRSEDNRKRFKQKHAVRELGAAEEVRLWKLLELQRHAMLMYTSCGWFFDELSGIETVQVMQYAARVVQLGEELSGELLEPHFMQRLAAAKSNLAEHGDGARIYERLVKPAMVDLKKLAAHYAISSLFESYPDRTDVYCYVVDRTDQRLVEAGKLRMTLGRGRFTSDVTQESQDLAFGVLHFGDHNLTGGVREYQGTEAYLELVKHASEAFYRADVPEVIRLLDRGFGTNIYSLKGLFKDEQRKLLDEILRSTVAEAETAYRQVYEHHASLLRFLHGMGLPTPKVFQNAASVALNSMLRHAFEARQLDTDRVRTLLDEARVAGADLDHTTLEYALRKRIEHLSDRFFADLLDVAELQHLDSALGLQKDLPFQLVLWSVQNKCYEVLQTVYPDMVRRAKQGSGEAETWIQLFHALGEKVGVYVEIPALASARQSPVA